MKGFYSLSGILLVFVSVFLLSSKQAEAQNGSILSGFRDVPQSSYLNPAFTSGASIVIGVPLLSNFSAGILTTSGGLSNFFIRDDGLTLDLTKAVNSDIPEDKVTDFVDMDLLFAGFKAGKTFVTVGVKQHLFVKAIFDRDLLNILWNGELEDTGNKLLDISNTNLNEYHLMDYHVGVSVPIGSKLRVGVRVHLLQGLSDISTENNDISLTMQENNDKIEFHARTSFLVNTSGFHSANGFDAGEYFTNFSNLGFAIDLGADMQVTKQIWVNASFLNIGSIYFQSKTRSYYPSTDSIIFDSKSFDLENSDDPLKTLSDTLQELFKINDEPRDYNMKLPFKFMIGGEYYTKDFRNSFSLLFSGQSYKSYFESTLSVAYTRFLSSHFSIKANYTWIKDAPVNFGLAMAANFFPFQFYLYSDNVPGLFQWDQQRYVQIGFGINIRIAPRNTRKSPHNPEAIHNLRPDIVR